MFNYLVWRQQRYEETNVYRNFYMPEPMLNDLITVLDLQDGIYMFIQETITQ